MKQLTERLSATETEKFLNHIMINAGTVYELEVSPPQMDVTEGVDIFTSDDDGMRGSEILELQEYVREICNKYQGKQVTFEIVYEQ